MPKLKYINKIVILLIILSKVSFSFSQNLIRNNSFEDVMHNITFNEIFYKKFPQNWYPLSKISSPDYYTHNNILCVPISSNPEKIKPIDGKRFIGFHTYYGGFKENIQSELNSELLKDSLYCLSMYVRLSENSNVANDCIEIIFLKDSIKGLQDKLLTNLKPSIILSKKYFILDDNWIKLQYLYKALGGEKYISLGCFEDLKSINFLYFKKDFKKRRYYLDKNNSSYYLFDNLNLYKIKNISECVCNYLIGNINSDTTIIKIEANLIKNDSLNDSDKKILPSDILYEFDNYMLKQEAYKNLDSIILYLNKNVDFKITINGYTDNIGSKKYNKKLSLKRAKSIFNYFLLKGIEKNRMVVNGFGEEIPISNNNTIKGRSENRRIEIIYIN